MGLSFSTLWNKNNIEIIFREIIFLLFSQLYYYPEIVF